MKQQITPGQRVCVSKNQSTTRLGPSKFPGRVGVVIRRNMCGQEHGGLWYVELEATTRAKARTETFWGQELRIQA